MQKNYETPIIEIVEFVENDTISCDTSADLGFPSDWGN